MVLPLPVAMMGAPMVLPSSLVRTMTFVYGSFIALELAMAVLRFYFLDIWGGVIMTLLSIFGAFVIRYSFDLQWTVMFGMTIFFYGLIHFVMLLERMVAVWPHFPDLSDTRLGMRDIVFIVSPIVDWTLTGLSYYMFRSATSVYMVGTPEERRPLTRSATRSSGTDSFVPFSGEGRKLA
jgi:hypothetical protein